MLDFPLNISDKSTIEKTKFNSLRALVFFGGLPVLTAVPTYSGVQGEIVWVKTGTNPSEVYALYGYIADNASPKVWAWRSIGTPDLSAYELLANKDTTITLGTSDTKYPSQKAVKSYVDNSTWILAKGSTLLASADTQRTHTETVYTKAKEIQMNRGGNSITISFDLGNFATAGNTHSAQIYKNGVAIGTQRTTTSNAGTFTTYSEDFNTAFITTDLFQLYVKTSNAGNGMLIQNFRIYINPGYTVNLD